jgi:fermentation-respiration switch protein FrsA (DUF1100 family)
MFLFFLLFFILFLFLSFKFYEHIKIYRPKEELIAFPSDCGIDFEDVNFSSRDHVLLNGWFIKGASPRVILLCHGNFGNISTAIDIIKELNLLGYNIFVFDYRGYGRSNGIPSERGLYYDALAAYDYLKNRGFPNRDIILFGRSLGGAVAILLASEIEGFRGVIIDSSFKSIHAMSYDALGFNFPRALISNRFESVKRIKKIKAPKLIIHSKDDNVIPFYHGEKLFEEALTPKRFLKIHGYHNCSMVESKDVYFAAVKDFLKSLEMEN